MMLQAALPVPEGFRLTAADQRRFLTETGLHNWIAPRVNAMGADLDAGLLGTIRARVVDTPLPSALRDQLRMRNRRPRRSFCRRWA